MARTSKTAETVDETVEWDDPEDSTRADIESVPDELETGEPDPWADLEDRAEASTTFERGSRVNVEKDVPAGIRNLIEKSLWEHGQEMEHGGKTVEAGKTKYRDIPMATAEHVKDFKRLARKYAQYRPQGQITVRAYTSEKNPLLVHFAAMPFVPRGKKGSDGSSTGE